MTKFVHYNDLMAGNCMQTGEPSVVWVPGEAVASLRVTVPPVSRKKWQAMIPWLLEEQLLERADDLLFHCGDRQRDGQVPVLAVNRQQMQTWQQGLASRSLPYTALVPDWFALPWQEGAVALGFRDGRSLARFDRWQGAAGDPAFLLPLVMNARPARLAVYYQGDKPALEAPEGIELRFHRRVDLLAPEHRDWLSLAEQRAPSGSPWSLPGKAAALLLALLIGLLAATSAVETRQIRLQTEFLDSELQRGYRQYFREPYDFAMADFQRVVSARLDGGGAGKLAAVAQLAQWLAGCPTCQVKSLSIAGSRLEASLSGAGVDQALGRAAQGNPALSVSRQGDGWRLTYALEVSDG